MSFLSSDQPVVCYNSYLLKDSHSYEYKTLFNTYSDRVMEVNLPTPSENNETPTDWRTDQVIEKFHINHQLNFVKVCSVKMRLLSRLFFLLCFEQLSAKRQGNSDQLRAK